MGACALTLGLAVTMMPAGALAPAGEAHAATTSALEASAATAASSRITRDATLTSKDAADSSLGVETSQNESDGSFTWEGLAYRDWEGKAGSVTLVGFDPSAPLLGNITVPESVQKPDGSEAAVASIAFDAGQASEDITGISIPASVEKIDWHPFTEVFPNLASIEVAEGSDRFSSYDGVLYKVGAPDGEQDDAASPELTLVYAPCALGRSITIALDCGAIADGAFTNARDVETLVVMGDVSLIGSGAFSQTQVDEIDVRLATPSVADGSADQSSRKTVALSSSSSLEERMDIWRNAGFASVDKLDPEGTQYDGDIVEGAESAGDAYTYTMLADGKLSASWKGAGMPTDEPVPECITVDGVAYQVAVDGLTGEPLSMSTYAATPNTDGLEAYQGDDGAATKGFFALRRNGTNPFKYWYKISTEDPSIPFTDDTYLAAGTGEGGLPSELVAPFATGDYVINRMRLGVDINNNLLWQIGYTSGGNSSLVQRGSVVPVVTDGYTFNGWRWSNTLYSKRTSGIEPVFNGDSFSGGKWAIWGISTPVDYSITYDAQGGIANGNPTTYNVESNDITLINPTRPGFTFTGWTGTGLTGPTTTVTIPRGSTGDRSYTANWRANKFTVYYHDGFSSANHGLDRFEPATDTGSVKVRTYTYATDGSNKWPSCFFAREGHASDCWAENANRLGMGYPNNAIGYIPAADGAKYHVYAKWGLRVSDTGTYLDIPMTGGIMFSTQAASSMTLAYYWQETTSFEDDYPAPGTGTYGYTDNCIGTFSDPFRINRIKLKVDKNNNLLWVIEGFTTDNPTAMIYQKGSVVPGNATGYNVLGWRWADCIYYATGNDGNEFASHAILGSDDKVATWCIAEPVGYTIGFDANGATGATPSQNTNYESGDDIAFPTLTKPGYTNDYWYLGTDTEANRFNRGDKVSRFRAAVAGGTTSFNLKAHWVPNTFEVTFDLDGGSLSPGTTGVTNGKATYTYGTAATLPTATLQGYDFADWYVTSSGAPDVTSTANSSIAIQSVAEAANAADRKVTVRAKWTYSVAYKLGDGATAIDTGFVKGVPKQLRDANSAKVPAGETAYGWSVVDGGKKLADITPGCEFGAGLSQRPDNSSTGADSETVYLYIVKEANGLTVNFKAGSVDSIDAAAGDAFIQIKKDSAVDIWTDVKNADDTSSIYTAGYSVNGDRDIPVRFRYRGHRLLGWYVEEISTGAKFTVGYAADGIEQVSQDQIIDKLLNLTSVTGSNARSATFTAQWRLERYDVAVMDTSSEGSLKVDLESWKSANQKLAALSRAKNSWTAEDVALNDGITFEYDAANRCYRGSYLYRSGFALPGHSFDFDKANPGNDYVEPDFGKKVDGNAYVAGYILESWYEKGSGGNVAVGTQSDKDIDASSCRNYTLYPKLEMKNYTLEYKVPEGAYLDGKPTPSAAGDGEPATGDGETATMSLTLTYKQIADASASDAADAAKAAATFPAAGKVKGYDWNGWSDASGWADSAKAGVPGIAPAGSNRPWKMLTDDVRKAIWNDDANNYWDNAKGNASSEEGAKPLYATWVSTGKVLPVTLAASQPAGAPGSDNPGGGQAPVSPDATRTAAFWPGKGLTYSKAASESYNGDDPATLPAATEGSYAETAIDPDLAGKIGLAPLSREGYTFVGWGAVGNAAADTKDLVYVYPDESTDKEHGADWCASDTHEANKDAYTLYVRCTQGDEGASYALTKTGAQLLNDWDGLYDDDNALGDNSAPADAARQWVAVWQAEAYDVVLRIPMNAVKSNAASSAPAESAEQALGDESDAGTSEPALDSKWSSTDLGGTPGWYRAKLRLHYWDKVTIPQYAQIDNSYTYDGWHSRQTSSDLDASGDYQVGIGKPGSPMGKPQAGTGGALPSPGDSSLAWGLRYDKDGNLRATKELNDKEGQDRQMWLRYKVIQIGVDSPVAALYLCADQYEQGDVIPAGKAVGDYVEDAYNTATDGRMLLESKVRFTTAATTSHDLVVSDVVCTTDAVGADGAATPAGERRLIADKIVKPTGSDERMFWLSTDDTVAPIKSDNWWTSRDTSGDKRGDGTDKGKRYWFGYENGQNALTHSADEGAGKADFSEFVVARPGSPAGTYGTYVETTTDGRPVERQSDGTYVARGVNDARETYTETVQLADIVRTTTFRYGLDLSKAKISIDANDPITKELLGKRDHMQGLARLTFTFKLPEALGQTDGSGAAGTASASL